MEIDCHIHSLHSPDSRSAPGQIVTRAVALGLEAIAITDHETIKGAKAAMKVAQGRILIVPGMELKTEKGDLLALFVDEDVTTRSFAEKVDEIHAKGGVAIVPHPGASPRITRAELSLADGYEAFNAILSAAANNRSLEKAAGLGKSGFGFSDAHLVREIGNGRTEVQDCESLSQLREVFLKNPRVSKATRSNPVLHRANEAILFSTKGIWRR